MVARDDHSASTRLLGLVDEIDLIQAFPLVRRAQLLGEIVVAHTARVHHRVRREDVLNMASLDRSDTRA